jgi:hypothetical protein
MCATVRVRAGRCLGQQIYALPDFWGLPLLVVGNKSGRWDALTAHAVRCAVTTRSRCCCVSGSWLLPTAWQLSVRSPLTSGDEMPACVRACLT